MSGCQVQDDHRDACGNDRRHVQLQLVRGSMTGVKRLTPSASQALTWG